MSNDNMTRREHIRRASRAMYARALQTAEELETISEHDYVEISAGDLRELVCSGIEYGYCFPTTLDMEGLVGWLRGEIRR